jgi:hypothetical protein
VYKALRGGVQDVAVKQLNHSGTSQLQKFSEVWVTLCSRTECAADHLAEQRRV